MAINDVSLTTGMRSNLLSLQGTVDLLNRTQSRLSSGKKVNSAIDNPVSYFASQALTARASVIDSLKDAMGQAVQTITAADKGITAITSMIEQAKGIAQSALSAAAGATTTLDGTTGVSVVGDVTIDLSGMTQAQTATVTFDLSATLTAGTSSVAIGSSTFTYTTGTLGSTNFTTAAGLAALISGITGYTATEDSGTITVVHASITTGAVTGAAITGQTQVNEDVTGDSITLTGGTVLTAGINFTNASTLVTALTNAGYTEATATGDLVTASKATTTLLADITSTSLTVAQGTLESRSYTVTDATNVAHTFAFTSGTDYTAGATSAGLSVGTALGTAIGNAGLGVVTVSDATVTVVGASSDLTSLQTQYNTLLAQLDGVAADSGYKGKNLLNGDVMSVKFEGINLTVTGFNANSTSLPIGMSTTGTSMWTKGETFIDASVNQLDTAMTKLRSESSKLSGNLSIITVRQDFSTNMINTLTAGSDKLTLADANEEGANMLMLQTRQSLSTTALSLSAQAAQSVLKLFG
jgi:flagellin